MISGIIRVKGVKIFAKFGFLVKNFRVFIIKYTTKLFTRRYKKKENKPRIVNIHIKDLQVYSYFSKLS